MKEYLSNQYLDFVNNFLTIKGFALHHDMSESQARIVLDLGKQFHEERVERYKVERE